MHAEARSYVALFRDDRLLFVLDAGGRDVNGNCRDLFPNSRFLVVDKQPGADVDVVADLTQPCLPEAQFGLILCTEVLEHVQDAEALLRECFRATMPGGRIIVTCAGLGRREHSGFDGERLRAGEHYANLSADRLRFALSAVGYLNIEIIEAIGSRAALTSFDLPGDLYATALKQ